jgi:tetratricopeptide (TPR) repeat protein
MRLRSLRPRSIRRAFLVRRAKRLERDERWADAIAAYAAAGVPPPPRVLSRLARRHRAEGRLPDAVTSLRAAVARRPTVKRWSELADCQVEMGDYAAAVEALRAAVALDPGNLTTRTNLGRTAARRSLVPFTVSAGASAMVPAAERDAAREEAVDQLQHVVGASDTRIWAAYWLGRLQEAHGLYGDALATYTEAVARIQTVDKPWAHHAALAWRFRVEYVERRLSGRPSGDERTNRTVEVRSAGGHAADAAGFFEASITNNGLQIDGFVRHSFDGSVELQVDGRPIVLVAPNQAAPWNREFKITIVHNVVAEFPDRSELTAWVGDRRLVTYGGAVSVDVVVPDGSGRLVALMDSGKTITKKGRWIDAAPLTGDHDGLYLAAYDRVKRFFDDELGIKLFVSYGTLLGCYRDGRPIPGDDDFDVSYVSAATQPAEFKADTRKVIEALLHAGFDSRVAVDGRMFHLRVGEVTLDINPIWFKNGLAWSFDAHRLAPAVFEPVISRNVLGYEVYLPARPEEFLLDNYGPDWKIPRSDFQYHRDRKHLTVLRQARLVPSEVRALIEHSEQLRARYPEAGRFHGYADLAEPRFGS